MKRIGLKPGGDNGTYFQDVAGSMRYFYAPSSRVTVDGREIPWNVDIASAPGMVAPRPVENAQVIFGGVQNDTLQTITAEQAAGKLVVLLPAPPSTGPQSARIGGAPRQSSAQKFSGAAAMAIVNLDGIGHHWIELISAPMRATSPRGGRAGAPPASALPAQAQFRLTSKGAAMLFGGNALSSIKPGTTGGMVTAKLDLKTEAQPTWTRNVIGILPGTDKDLKDQWILIDAHYDHLGMRAPMNGDSVFNGADDDASGTTAVLEIARAMKAGKAPKRSMIFAAMTGEESGLVGTSYYLAHPYVPMEKLVANMEIEMIGRPDSLSDGEGGAWLTGYERSTMGPTFAAAGLRVFPDKRPSQSFFTRSDNRAFACAGIPAHTLSTFNLHRDYHQLSDDADTIDFPHMTEVIRSGAVGARMLADGEAPKWVEGGSPVGTPTCGR
jgi:Zn-dependent M28 family amino/carboxypeptidase